MPKTGFDQYLTIWPPSHVKKVLEGPDANEYLGIGMSMMFYLKTQARLGNIQTNRIAKTLADGTQIVATTCFGNDKIYVVRPDQGQAVVEEPGGGMIYLYLVNTAKDFKVFYLDLGRSTSEEVQYGQFWSDENFYQGPWEASDWGGGFGSGTAYAYNNFKESQVPLVLDTITYNKWNIVEDDNWNMAGLTYFPTLVLMNVPGTSTHSMLSSENCYDYPLCWSAIIPANSCYFCFAFWPFHGILPLGDQSYNIPEYALAPLLNDAGLPDWIKKSQVWSRGAVTGTPRVGITGKTNFTMDETGVFAETYRESIEPVGSLGTNNKTGTWWNTWNQVLHVYQPCWVDIAHGFGGDEAGWWPWYTWLHETPSTGIAHYPAYANHAFGGNTRQARGDVMRWLKFDKDNPSADPVMESLTLTGLNETLNFVNNSCILSTTVENREGPNCMRQNGTFYNAYADGTITGEFFAPVATLGNKRFIYFQNVFSAYIGQYGYRFDGGYYWCNMPYPICNDVSPCCTALGWSCFGSCPGCADFGVLHCEQEQTDMTVGEQTHTLSLIQTFKIGKALSTGKIEDVVIETGTHNYLHTFHGERSYNTGVTVSEHWPAPTCDDPRPYYRFCTCNDFSGRQYPDYESNSETETYSRDITTFEVVEYAADPKKNFVAIIYKKIIIQHTCSTTDNGGATNWTHSGTRSVTWKLYVNLDGIGSTFTLNPAFVSGCYGGENPSHTGSGTRLWGGSLQVNEDYLAFSYLEESWGGLGANFGSIIGQNIYPGPMNLEDRIVEPFYDGNGELVWENVGVTWNPVKYHYGVIQLSTGEDQFKKWEWTLDQTDKKVYAVGLLSVYPSEGE
jgi:hypothetical protein